MQKDFVDGALGTAEAQAILLAVEEKVKNWPVCEKPAFGSMELMEMVRNLHREHPLESIECVDLYSTLIYRDFSCCEIWQNKILIGIVPEPGRTFVGFPIAV